MSLPVNIHEVLQGCSMEWIGLKHLKTFQANYLKRALPTTQIGHPQYSIS